MNNYRSKCLKRIYNEIIEEKKKEKKNENIEEEFSENEEEFCEDVEDNFISCDVFPFFENFTYIEPNKINIQEDDSNEEKEFLDLNLNEKQLFYNIGIPTLSYTDNDWKKILGLDFQQTIPKFSIFFQDFNNKLGNTKFLDLIIFLLNLKVKKKISNNLLNLIIKIINLFFETKIPNYEKIIEILELNTYNKIVFCCQCNKHIFNVDKLIYNSNENIIIPKCPLCGEEGYEKKNLNSKIYLQPKSFIYKLDIIKFLIGNIMYGNLKQFENNNSEYSNITQNNIKKIISKNQNTVNSFYSYDFNIDGVSLFKNNNISTNITSFSFDKLILVQQILDKKLKNQNLSSYILMKEISFLSKGLIFYDSNIKKKAFFLPHAIKMETVQQVKTLNIVSYNIACPKCLSTPLKFNEKKNEQISNKKKIKKNKYNWNSEVVEPNRNVINSIDSLRKFPIILDKNKDINLKKRKGLKYGNPLYELFPILNWDLFLNNYSCEELHNSSGIFKKIIKTLTENDKIQINSCIKNIYLTKSFNNNINFIDKYMNCTTLNLFFSSIGKIIFSLNEKKKNPKIKIIKDLCNIKENLDNLYKEKKFKEIEKINNIFKNNLLQLFKEKNVFTINMHTNCSHKVQEIKYLGLENSVQNFERNFTNFHKYKNGKNYSMEEVITSFNLNNYLEILNKTIEKNDVNNEVLKLLISMGVVFDDKFDINIEDKLFIDLGNNFFGFKKGKREVKYEELGEKKKKKLLKFKKKKNLSSLKFQIFEKIKIDECIFDNKG